MTRFTLGSAGEVLESVYDLELTEETWIQRITEGVAQSIDGGNGTLGCIFRMNRGLQMPVLSPFQADAEVPDFIQYLRANQQDSEAAGRGFTPQAFGSLFAESGMGTLSVNRKDAPAYRIFSEQFESKGIRDAAGLIVPHPESNSFIFFTSRQMELSVIPPQAKARWVGLQQHIAAVYNLRHRLGGGNFDETDAVWFDTSGGCVEKGPTRDDETRDRLRAIVRERENSGHADTSYRRADLERYWSNVVDGKWAILDRFDTDGRRFVIAIPVGKKADTLRGLTARERAVFEQLATGASNKVIAIDLATSESAVSSHLNNAYRKLGITDRSMAVQIARGAFGIA